MKLSKIKTGSFERRLSLTKAGLVAGTRMAGQYTATLFSSKEVKANSRKRALSREALYLAGELGKLKGSVVKIGQIMALYGEHFLPVEVTEALHTLEEKTQALDWSIIRGVLFENLGSGAMAELDIEEEPIGTASLGQVHRARVKATGEQICLKVQYPGVAEAIDADLDAVAQILRLANFATKGPAFDDWLNEVRLMMHKEVNYLVEAETTARFHEMLKDDDRYIVPRVFPDYSDRRVLATSYEPGYHVSSSEVAALPQGLRDALGLSFLDLFLRELFIWHEMQTDPNFGNYRVRVDDSGAKLVLLDFGAVQAYSSDFIYPVCSMIKAAYYQDLSGVIEGGIALEFMKRDWPDEVLNQFGQVCMAVLEPLVPRGASKVAGSNPTDGGDQWYGPDDKYSWYDSDLPTRIAKRAARSALNRYFKIPPKEFVFLNRKLVGVYTFISVLHAEFNGESLLKEYIDGFTV
jgi:predicted unusual protein kinase regulating ubiquinone biosynthesis (AarF/ABC1/UbiB family)